VKPNLKAACGSGVRCSSRVDLPVYPRLWRTMRGHGPDAIPRIEDRARTIEARKPWLKLGMSRRTWYRRRAEKREARQPAAGLNPGAPGQA
jgi:hypothetical protein